MFDTIKLEKGMYHLTNKTFTQALEAADPSEQYAGTPMEGLDAFERQLKRFDIHVSGEHCDRVEKFFTTTESAVLFPEFVRRAVRKGMEETILPDMTAACSHVSGTVAKGFSIDETDGAYSTVTAEGANLKITAITEAVSPIALNKYGRVITASYETVRQQRIDVFAVLLRAVGRKIGNAVAAAGLSVLSTAATATTITAPLTYAHLTTLYGAFTDYPLSAVIASPKNVGAILAMTEMSDRVTDAQGTIRLPFGAKLLADSSLGDKTVLGISGNFALECIMGSDVLLETDQLINCQLDRIAVSVRVGFAPLMAGTAAKLTWT